jgi:hypothetical protein
VTVKKNSPIPKTIESPNRPTADEIAELAYSGEDVSRFFATAGWMMPPIAPEKKKPAAFYTRYDIVKR